MVTSPSEHQAKIQAWIRAGVAPHPSDSLGWVRFAETLHGGNALRDACHAYWHLALLQPDEPAYPINAGNLLLELEDFQNSLFAFDEAMRRGGGDAVACHLGRGLALLYLQQYQQSEKSLREAWRREPDACDVALAYSQCLMELERFDEISACLAYLAERDMSRAQRESFAWLLAHCGEEARAIALYQDLLDETDATLELRMQLVLLLERLNRLDEAAGYLQHRAVAAGDTTPMTALAMGRMRRRQKQHAAADACLEAGLAVVGEGALGALLEFERAKNADADNQFDAAMAALERAHTRAVVAYQRRFPDQTRQATLAWLGDALVAPAPQGWRTLATHDGLDDPTFLVGFPRSGTTLLERILDAHPALDVLDERPALEEAIASLPSWDAVPEVGLDERLAALSSDQIASARGVYFNVAARYVSVQQGIVDKYPLNLTRVPYIARLFPRARYVLLLRDPCDCVLSCYMQAFGLRGGALSFATLESSAETYVEVMSYWERHRALVDAQVHVLRYEDLVRDMPAQVASLLHFMESAWDDAMADFQMLARSRSVRINTPSYAQVIEPINDRAVGRWKNYRQHFSPRTLELLAPWRRRYGYA
ncbi:MULTISPECIES: tetratricopeptide repeat-containing sulfotransferase family protein [Xanthomonas]|uniref:Sulfotransferase n=1 Tax=Xanthomonas cucurbitae TaxID=56453 RepID=A0ABY7Y9F5_9XANT|nr:sulfotransferase [Xanthomonas cucurbitae]QHG87766.1 sulfotransferase family protein [Xanthomonas cucurbitae]WDM66636.1 sulfotransferase [Xanthomonas cucurbitae]WDM70514.1 sulfotransferase [Xanthomonas cucurbitae]WDM74383.1 sulfotransferase [Xanthomonas cucurbitae]